MPRKEYKSVTLKNELIEIIDLLKDKLKLKSRTKVINKSIKKLKEAEENEL